MNIGIISYSQTGNTKSVAEALKEKLSANGHTVSLEQVVPQGEVTPGMKEVNFKEKPDVSQFEGIVFASPVQAFRLAAPMKAYLSGIGPLKDKRIGCFVTKQLPWKWTGGNKALKQMKKLCGSQEGTVLGEEIIFWSSDEKEEMIKNCVERLAGLFA